MPGLSSRHPRYTIFLTLLVLAALFLLLPDSSSPYGYNAFYDTPAPHPSGGSQLNIVDVGLPSRVARAERIYEKMLAKRKGLFRKFGGDSKTIVPCVLSSLPPWLEMLTLHCLVIGMGVDFHRTRNHGLHTQSVRFMFAMLLFSFSKFHPSTRPVLIWSGATLTCAIYRGFLPSRLQLPTRNGTYRRSRRRR